PDVEQVKVGGLQRTKPADRAEADKAALRYDGKSFDEWQTAWRTELSTEKRIEAVNALAAFGANGYGPQAAEAILEIADQYDWVTAIRADGVRSTEPEGKLQRAVFEALVGRPGTVRIDARYWLPQLRKRYEADPQKWQDLLLALLARARSGNG